MSFPIGTAVKVYPTAAATSFSTAVVINVDDAGNYIEVKWDVVGWTEWVNSDTVKIWEEVQGTSGRRSRSGKVITPSPIPGPIPGPITGPIPGPTPSPIPAKKKAKGGKKKEKQDLKPSPKPALEPAPQPLPSMEEESDDDEFTLPPPPKKAKTPKPPPPSESTQPATHVSMSPSPAPPPTTTAATPPPPPPPPPVGQPQHSWPTLYARYSAHISSIQTSATPPPTNATPDWLLLTNLGALLVVDPTGGPDGAVQYEDRDPLSVVSDNPVSSIDFRLKGTVKTALNALKKAYPDGGPWEAGWRWLPVPQVRVREERSDELRRRILYGYQTTPRRL